MHGLDLYDYGARQYDPVVPMFTQQDPMAEKYYHLSPYVYCGNNPVNAFDPDGKKVQIVARQLNPYLPTFIGVHTFIVVSQPDKKPVSYTYGPHSIIGGKLERTSYDYDNQIVKGEKTKVDYQIIDVPVPDGLTEQEFDANIDKAAKQFEGNTEINYNIITNTRRTGNCNTSTTTLLEKAGVSKEVIKELGKQIKGNAYGFGEDRPWTKEERKQLQEEEE